ncbi:hypothetical protein HK100_000916 [Physocladia obscura]|uniref:Steroid 5-alpha reductase C-terminal domain-containing protein n=1 Tax=Physocladia obscura TaxID=109957 RepID=A0AAD5SYL4_9FUNG|nr:hypothetical protein HK100_000916 [Physocladia obscura]
MISNAVVWRGFAAAVAANVGINAVGYAYSAYHKTEKFYDLCGSGAFLGSLTAAVVATKFHRGVFIGLHPRQLIIGGTLAVWSFRLASFLAARVHRYGDKRFDAIKGHPLKFAVYWAIQIIWVGVVGAPTIATVSADPTSQQPLNLLDFSGLALWVAGFAFEAIADKQKREWQDKQGEDRRKKFIDTGLWAWCRYPNYLGEMTLWVGSYLVSTRAFPASPVAKYAFSASPLFISYLLTRLSGIPIQERQAKVRFAGSAEYADYVAKTNPLLPWPPSRKSFAEKEKKD